MNRLAVLLTFGLRKTYKMAARWLKRTSWDSLFLNLPFELESTIKDYAEEKIDESEFWKDYALLSGLSEPFIYSQKLKFQPILDCLRDVDIRDREVYGYQDLISHIEKNKIVEKIVLLEFRDRVSGRFDLKAWKEILFQEAKISEESWDKSLNLIMEEAKEKPTNIILYGGYLKLIKKYLSRPDRRVEIVSFGEFWKSPLDILRTIFWKHGFNKIPDKTVEHYLQLQITYLNIILKFENIDEAHKKWTRMIKTHPDII